MQNPVGQKEPGPVSRAARRVLVVDDSRMQRLIVSMALRGWGFQVEEADSGEAALEFCRSSIPDIVISDWMMPGLSGPEFCRAFRSLTKETYGYFVLLTSKSDKIDVAEGLDSGADDFLTKPVNTAELRARLTAGERILDMQEELRRQKSLIEETLGELQQLYDSLDSDLLEAKKLQQSLVREREISFETADLSQILRSAGRVGGDLVGFYPIGPDRLAIYSIDVSGHGVSSALATARLAGFLSSAVPHQNIGLIGYGGELQKSVPPPDIARTLNDIALAEMDTGQYFTMALAEIDLTTGAVCLVQAGHPYPVIQRANGRVEFLGDGGFPVGLIDGAEFEPVQAQLEPGDRLILLSDGVTECADASGDMLGDEGLAEMLTELCQTRGAGFLEALVWMLAQRRNDMAFEDDVSVIVLDYSGTRAAR
ncbi:PP2C family protein-serine/threonine phosphatase [Pseudooceanicola sp. C21-150M6]|uniref:PP2C family protein-serine/threonine phosphatase n=1 Tax=Pseudooceanicola sp. C21-150M6 TaxID=3434355 RepID=UPI003D7FE3E2